jgi:hypothetical protein
MPADDDDDDFGFGEDFADIDDFDDDEDDDGVVKRGSAAVICFRTANLTTTARFFEGLGAAVEAAGAPCADPSCLRAHAVAARDARGRIRIRPGPCANLAVPELSAAMSARLRDPRTEKRRQLRIEANARRRQRRLAAKQQQQRKGNDD